MFEPRLDGVEVRVLKFFPVGDHYQCVRAVEHLLLIVDEAQLARSLPMPLRTSSMPMPSLSASGASPLMKLMRVASMTLAAYLVNSALLIFAAGRRSNL